MSVLNFGQPGRWVGERVDGGPETRRDVHRGQRRVERWRRVKESCGSRGRGVTLSGGAFFALPGAVALPPLPLVSPLGPPIAPLLALPQFRSPIGFEMNFD